MNVLSSGLPDKTFKKNGQVWERLRADGLWQFQAEKKIEFFYDRKVTNFSIFP